MKSQDSDRQKLRKEYADRIRLRLQLNPIVLHVTHKEILIDSRISDPNKIQRLIKVITYDEFEIAMLENYSSWYKNRSWIKIGNGKLKLNKFLPESIFEQGLVDAIISVCKKHFLRNFHSLDIFRKMVHKDLQKYILKIVDTRRKLKNKTRNYPYLIPAFRVISDDFFDSSIRQKMRSLDLKVLLNQF